jgi:hypothetical protein
MRNKESKNFGPTILCHLQMLKDTLSRFFRLAKAFHMLETWLTVAEAMSTRARLKCCIHFDDVNLIIEHTSMHTIQ